MNQNYPRYLGSDSGRGSDTATGNVAHKQKERGILMASPTISAGRAMHDMERQGRQAAASPGAILLVRAGYAAKGVVYLIIGLLAARLALSNGGNAPDRQTALTTIASEPFGKTLLALMAIGLAGYALWSFVRAALDPEREGTGGKGIVTRLGFAAVGVSYGLLAFGAYHIVSGTGTAGQSSNATTQDWTARLLHEPFGVALVVLLGLVVLGVAFFLFRRAYTASFQKRLALQHAETGHWVVGLGRFGLAALGVVFTEIGIFLLIAAVRRSPQDAQGLSGALGQLLHEPYGHVLLAIVAIGLAAYGIFSLAQARYRRIGTA